MFVGRVSAVETTDNHEPLVSLWCTGLCCSGNHPGRQNVTSLVALTKVETVLSLRGHRFFSLPFGMALEIEVDKLKSKTAEQNKCRNVTVVAVIAWGVLLLFPPLRELGWKLSEFNVLVFFQSLRVTYIINRHAYKPAVFCNVLSTATLKHSRMAFEGVLPVNSKTLDSWRITALFDLKFFNTLNGLF